MKQKRFLTFLLAALMILTLLPAAAFAAGETYTVTLVANTEAFCFYEGDPEYGYSVNAEYEVHLTVAAGESLELTNSFTATAKNLMFECWSGTQDGLGYRYDAGEEITPEENMTLYAIWDEVMVFDYDPDDTSEIAGYVRERMVEREPYVRFRINDTPYRLNKSDFMRILEDEVKAHTGIPWEGDYLRWQMGENGVFFKELRDAEETSFTYLVTYYADFYTTAEMEEKVSAAIYKVLDGLDLNGRTDYEKFDAIYRYIIDHVEYDEVNLDDDSYDLKYSAYAALINGTSVCQGYAGLLYRMLLEVGVDCRVIPGTGIGDNGPEEHAWNIVRLGELYYNVDATWDDGTESDIYTLRCKRQFPDHTRDAEYDTAEFNALYPMSRVDYEPQELPEFSSHQAVLSGTIGLIFLMDIPEGCEDNTVIFSVGEQTFDAQGEDNGDGRVKFVCPVTSIEMAEEVTAEFNFTLSNGEIGTRYDGMSLAEYLEVLIEEDYEGKTEETVELAKAIWNYGYWAQKALPGGPDHPEMIDKYAAETGLVNRLSEYPIEVVELDSEIFSSASYSLDLQSETAVNFYLKTDRELTKDDVDVITEEGVDVAYTVEKTGSSWRVQITGIGAHELGSVFTLKTEGAEISASALSYAQNCLADNYAEAELQNTVAALYAYYNAAMAYKAAMANNN